MSKLVRDKIPEIITKDGRKPIIHVAENAEYLEKIKEKLKEEVEEFLENSNTEELADILEVIHTIAEYKQITLKELEALQKKKAKERGRFRKKIILDSIQ